LVIRHFFGNDARAGEAVALELHSIVIVEIVQSDDLIASLQQAMDYVESDESGGAGDEYFHGWR
jgi:hypothetical protein